MDPKGNEAAPEPIASNSRYLLTRDTEGFTLRSARAENDTAVASFPRSSEGEERAKGAFRRRTREARAAFILTFGAVAAGFLWIAANIVSQIAVMTRARASFDEAFPRWELWVALVQQTSFTVFIVAVGLSLVLWLHVRWREGGRA